MAGQGITVSIQAKIEGWQEQIKQIQNAMKNIKPGAEISKGLMKDLQQVETMVNNLGKNMTQRFTSDSQITSFVDRMKDVERIFDRIGSSMQGISFGDIKPEYITANFKDLLNTLEQANNALGTGMQSSFQSAITESKNLQKEFAKMKLDPKDMNIDQIRGALQARGESLAKEMQQAQAETDKLKKKMDEARAARDQLQQRKDYIGNDPNAKLIEIFGGKIPTNGTILDQKQLETQLENIRASFVKMGFTEAELGRILPSVDKLMQAAQWDQIPQKLERYIRDAAIKTQNSLDFAQARFDESKVKYQAGVGAQNKVSASVYGNNMAQQDLESFVMQKVEEATRQLREEVAQLRAQLEGKATAGFKSLAKDTQQSSMQGFQDATAAADQYYAALERVKAGEQMVGKIQGVIQRWFSVYAVVRMVTNAIKKAAKNIQELDSTMTQIAIVTKMDQGDLWSQMPKYTKMARDYASSIKGVYEVSQIYYQQGLEMNDVMSLTESTLKMARISGLGYSEAADYMTNAIRSFKMEMTDAERVVDVYSAVAASSASNVTELATAMSKTASSAQAVGSSFENTTAMLAVMIEATRESPENIGSAMKSIISRYGELKENKTGIDEEGEEYSLNKVDKALQTVGISIHDAKGEFRDFDDVIFELAEHWNEIDKNTQRYIATVMAGNRQQSRFLALVSSSERLKEESAKATNSEDAAQLQFLKSLDSIDAKKQQLETSIQSIYTSSGIENLYKGLLDFNNNILISFDNLSSEQGLGAAITKIGATFMTLATLVKNVFNMIKAHFTQTQAEMIANAQLTAAKQAAIKAKEVGDFAAQETAKTEITKAEIAKRVAAEQKAQAKKMKFYTGVGMVAATAGLTLTTAAANLDVNKDRQKKAALTGFGGLLSGAGTGLMIGGIPGFIIGALTAIPSLIEAAGIAVESTEEKIERLQKNIDDTKNETLKSKSEVQTLQEYKEKYDELKKSRYDSVEAEEKYKELIQEIGTAYPELIKSMDTEGNYILDMTDAYTRLIETKTQAYSEDFITQLSSEYAALQDIDYILEKIYNMSPAEPKKNILGQSISNMDKLNSYYKESFLDTNNPTFIGKRSEGIGDTGFQAFTKVMSSKNIGVLDELFFPNLTGFITPEWYNQKNNDIGIGILAKIYDSYKQSVEKELTYEAAKIEARKLTFDEFINPETAGYAEYMEMANNAIEYFGTKIEKTAEGEEKITAPEYERFQAVYGALKTSEQLLNSMYDVEISKYLSTLATSYTTTTGDIVSDFQSSIIKNNLIPDLSVYMAKNYDKVKNKQQYEINGQKYTYDEKKLISDYFEENEIDIDWYKEQIEALPNIPETIESIYKNIGKIGPSQLEDELRAVGGDLDKESFQFLLEKLIAAQEKSYDTIIKNYDKWATEGIDKNIGSEETHDLIQEFSELFGPEYLIGIQDQYKTILKNTNLTDQQKSDQFNILTDIINMITNFDDKTASQIIQKIQTADFTSLFGIYDFINQIESLDLGSNNEAKNDFIQKIKDFSQIININFITEIESYIDSLEGALEGMDTDISDATKGMNVKKAHKMATNLGKHLSDFDIRDGKFYYNNVEDIIAYYDKTDTEYEEALQQRIDKYKNIQSVFDSIGISSGDYDINQMTEQQKTGLKASYDIEYEELKSLYNSFQKQINATDGYKDFLEYLNAVSTQEAEAVKKFITQQKAISSLQTLGFDAFWQAADLSSFDDQKQAILEAAQAQDFSEIQKNEELYDAIQPYIGTLLSFFKDVNSTVVNSLIDAVGTGKNARITVTEANRKYLKELQGQGLFDGVKFDNESIIGQSVSILVDEANGIEEIIFQEIAKQFATDAEKLEAYQKYHANKYKNNKFDNFNKLAQETISYEDFTNYLSKNIGLNAETIGDPTQLARAAEMYGLSMNAAGNFYVSNWTKRIEKLNADLNRLLISKDASIQDINAARAAVKTAEQGQQIAIRNAAKDLITNYTDISVEQQQALADALGVDSSTLLKYYTTGIDGITRLNINDFKSYVATLAPEIQEALMPLFTDIADDYIKNITDAVSLVSKGTTSQSDISTFITKAKEFGIDATNAFSFDSLIDAWTLDPLVLRKYIVEQAKALQEAGILVGDQFNIFIQSQTEKAAAQNVDFMSFLQAENQNQSGIAYKTLEHQLTNYYALSEYSKFHAQAFKNLNGHVASTNEIINKAKDLERMEVSQRWAELDEKDYESLAKQELTKTFGEDYTTEALQEKMASLRRMDEEAIIKEFSSKNYNEQAKMDLSGLTEEELQAETDKLIKAQADLDITTIKAGGQLAVNKAKELAEKAEQELSTEEIENYFYSEVNRIKNYSDSLAELTTGQYVAEGEFKNILRSVGMIDSSGMVTNIENMAIAYKAIYDKMGKTGESTATQLNKIYAQYLTETERGDIDAIAAMGDAMGMSYETLGEILGRTGDSLEEWLNNVENSSMYEKIGAGKIRITDFTAFAAQRGWQPGSEEYTSAFKAYNDSLIEYNKNIKESIYDEVKGLENVKPGDQLNLTELYTELQKRVHDTYIKHEEGTYKWERIEAEDPLGDIQKALAQYDAYLVDGILKLGDNANLLEVSRILQQAALEAGSDMTNELADLVESIIKSYTEAIIKGIQGGLTNTEAADLRAKAADLGIDNLSFIETAEGLKLAQSSATQLYFTLKQIDALQASLVFKELNESLQATNEHYKGISDIAARIKAIEGMSSSARTEQYEQELALAKEIYAVRSTTEDSSFSFMSNKIPGAQNNPINYFNDWAKAIHTFNDALHNKERGKYTRGGKTYESGFVDYQDWYNIVTEMNNIAALGGDIQFAGETLDGSLEAASRLIEKGAASLVATSTGDIKVALSGMSLDFESGADAFSGGVTEGIQALAQSQVEMLDGMIQLLETVVAMEKLGDITGDNEEIDITDLFPTINWEDGKQHAIENQQAIDWINNELLGAAEDSDIAKFIDGVELNGQHLRDVLTDAVTETKGVNKENAEALTSLLNALWQMSQSQQFDLDNIYDSMSQIANAADLNMTIPTANGKVIIERGAIVIETKDKDKNTVYKDPSGKTYKNKQEALAASIMSSMGVDTKGKDYSFDAATGAAKGKLTLDGVDVEVARNADGSLSLKDTKGITGNNLNEYIENVIAAQPTEELKIEKRFSLGLQTGSIKLDSFSYRNISSDLRKQLEDALSSGQKTKIDAVTEANPIFKQLNGKSGEEIAQALGIDFSLSDNITRGIANAIPNITAALNEIDASGPQEAADALGEMVSNLQQLQGIGYETIARGLSLLGSNLSSNGKQNGQANAPKVTASTAGVMTGIKTDAIDNITSALGKIKFDNAGLNAAAETINSISATNAKTAAGAISGIKTGPAMMVRNTLNNLRVGIEGKTVQAIANIIVRVQHTGSSAKGNVALAGGTPTLMGELGPELVVSNGRYFVVGQGGAEFVSLEKDAIVFNHRQTEKLLTNGNISSRGKPFTNETNAISYAKGNYSGGPAHVLADPNPEISKDIPWKTGWSYNYQIITQDGGVSGHLWNAPIAEITFPASAKGSFAGGPAQASASAALAALKQLRAEWQALAGLSAQDLAGKGGGGGGGGGDPKAFLKDLEKWYDWLQQIAQLEKEITLEESKRSKYQNDMIARGKEYYTSQLVTLEKLKEQIAVQQSLNNSQQAYFEKRRKELNRQSAFSALYGFSETGQLYYKDVYANSKSAFEWLSDLAGRNTITGEANYTAKEQYERLAAAGFDFAMKYDSSGNEIKREGEEWYNTAVQAFWDKIDSDKEEMQNLHDAIEDRSKTIVELESSINDQLHDIEDNQITVEGKVLKALEDSRQRAIDDAKDTKEAIEESANKLIDGLNRQLENERNLYQNQQNQEELNTIQRRLAILQRAGGSAAEIADLRAQIEEKQYDRYFDTQQQQIDAIQDASDAELERLDNQITLMEETLAYEKEHGLLWEKINEILSQTPEEISNYIKENTSEYWSKSGADLAKQMREDLFEIDQFKAMWEDIHGNYELMYTLYSGEVEKKKQEQASAETSSAENGTGTTSGGTTGGTVGETAGKPGKSKAINAAAAGALAGASIASYKNTSAFNGAVDGSDLLYYQTEDGRIGIVRGENRKQALYHLDQMEGELGKIVGVTSSYGDLPAAQAARAAHPDDPYYLLENSLFTPGSGGGVASQEKTLTPEMQELTKKYLQSDEGKSNEYRWGYWEGKNGNVNPIDTAVYTNPKTGEEKTVVTDVSKTAFTKAQLAEIRTEYNDKERIAEQQAVKQVQRVPGTTFTQGNKTYQVQKDGSWKVVYKKASGGYVNHGFYELGELGTETVLTASQTKVLHDNILSNRPDSLISLLKSYNQAYHGLSQATYDSISNNSTMTTTIERAEVNLNIDKLADDYDSKRAANTIMDEMLRIASKTKASNSIRR